MTVPAKYGRPRFPISDAEIRAAWSSDEKLDSIATRLGCCIGTVCYRAKRLGLPLRHPSRGVRLTVDGRSAIVAELGSATDAAIAARHGVHETTVAKIRRRVTGRKRRVYAWDRAKLRIACDQGMTLEEIAAATGRDSATVRHALKRFGLRYRRTDRRKPIDVKALLADWRARMSFSEMARKHGFSGPGAVKARIGREMSRLRQAVAS